MEENQIKPELYTIPYTVHSSYKLGMHVFLILIIMLFLGGPLFLPINDAPVAAFKLLWLMLGLFFAFNWFYVGVLKRAYIKLTDEGLTHRNLYVYKKIKWSDIASVNTFCMSNSNFIGITTKDKIEKSKDNFLSFLSEMFTGKYSVSIPLRLFHKTDPEKLFATIYYRVKEEILQKGQEKLGSDALHSSEDQETELNRTVDNSEIKAEPKRKPGTALIKALIVSLVSGIIYGLSIYLLNTNFILIPILGMIWILYTYFKNNSEIKYNLLVRLFLGIVCTVQLYIATLINLLLINQKFIIKYGIVKAIQECTANIIKYPDKYLVLYIFGLLFFVYSVFTGYSSRTTRSIRQLFMKRKNGLYINRNKRYLTVYLKEYADINKNGTKKLIRIDPNLCLIEREKKDILAFHIPKELIQRVRIDTYYFEKVFSDEDAYYKLDLGGHSEPQTYGYNCFLTFDESGQIEYMELEID